MQETDHRPRLCVRHDGQIAVPAKPPKNSRRFIRKPPSTRHPAVKYCPFREVFRKFGLPQPLRWHS
jgi:hypothetical protein